MVNDRIAVQERPERLAEFRTRIAVVFERLPMLSGFFVTEDLSLKEVTVQGWPGSTNSAELKDVIVTALENLVADDAADATELLRGMTFARAVH
jgi:hypothetical protein